MTLTDQLAATQAQREADSQNYDMQLAKVAELAHFINEQKGLSLNAHDKGIEVIKAQIEAHKAFIGEKVVS